MILKFYDEFGIFTTDDDIKTFINSLINSGEDNDRVIYKKCIDIFGNLFSDTIENCLYYED